MSRRSERINALMSAVETVLEQEFGQRCSIVLLYNEVENKELHWATNVDRSAAASLLAEVSKKMRATLQ